MNKFYNQMDGEYINTYEGNLGKRNKDLIWYNQLFGMFYKKLDNLKNKKNKLEIKLK